MIAAVAAARSTARLGTRRVAAALRDRRGVAAVEFAMVLPVLLILYFGLTELTLAMVVDRKVTSLSRVLADLVSRAGQMSTNSMDNVFDSAVMVMRPYDNSTVQMVVSSVLVAKVGNVYVGTVDWSCGRNLSPLAQQISDPSNNLSTKVLLSTYAVPAAYQATNVQSFIIVETLMPYLPTVGRYITSRINLRESTPWPARNGTKVLGPTPCPAG